MAESPIVNKSSLLTTIYTWTWEWSWFIAAHGARSLWIRNLGIKENRKETAREVWNVVLVNDRKISWTDTISNDVLSRVNEKKRSMLITVRRREANGVFQFFHLPVTWRRGKTGGNQLKKMNPVGWFQEKKDKKIETWHWRRNPETRSDKERNFQVKSEKSSRQTKHLIMVIIQTLHVS